jgi:hypothetical protein
MLKNIGDIDLIKMVTFKMMVQIIFICLLIVAIFFVANLPIGLKYDYKTKSYVNFIGITKIKKIYDIKRHCENCKNPFVIIVEGYGFEKNKATVWVGAEQSDYFYPLCINTAGDIIYYGYCDSKQADDFIIKYFEHP